MSTIHQHQGAVAQPEFRPYREVRSGFTYFGTSDVIFAKITPCMQNGKHAIVPQIPDGRGFGSTEFHVIRPGNALIPEWIHLFVRQPAVLTQAMAHFTGAVGQQRVPDGFLADLEIPLPPLLEQHRISSLLATALGLIDRARAAAKARLAAASQLPATDLRRAFEACVCSELVEKAAR